MPRNGSGTYTLPEPDFVSGTTISSTAMNSNLGDVESALTASIASDGQTTPTANLPMGGYAHTGVGNASARNQYAALGQIQDGAGIWTGTAGGTADALTLTPSPAITAYAAGQLFRFVSSAANTGAATVAVSGLAAKAIQLGGSALSAGAIPNGALCSITYDGTQFQLHSVSQGLADITGKLDDVMTTRGDITYEGASGPARLAVGTNGQVLKSDGTDPTWGAIDASTDQVARAMAAAALLNQDLSAGLNGVFIAYDWSSDTLATSTNATNDASANSYKNVSESTVAGGTGTAIGNYTDGGGLSTAFDGNLAQNSVTGPAESSNLALHYIGKDWGVGNTKYITEGSIWNNNSGSNYIMHNAGDVSVVVELRGSNTNDASAASVLGTLSTTQTTVSNRKYTVTATDTSTAYRYHWVTVRRPGGESNQSYIAEAEFKERTVDGNMTLVPAAVTLDTASPDDVSMFVLVDALDGGAPASDVKARFTLDDGTTWTTAAAPDSVQSMPGGTDRALLRFDDDVSAQTGGSAKWEITTANSEGYEVFEPIFVPLY